MAKYKSIVGVPFASYVDGQLAARQKTISSKNRNNANRPGEINWLSNRTGWYRMSSGALEDATPGDKLAKQKQKIMKIWIKLVNLIFGNLIYLKVFVHI